MRPTSKNRELARLERFTEEPNRFGAYRIALGFPNSYEVGMSNLGFQWVYRLFNRVPDLVCERFFHITHHRQVFVIDCDQGQSAFGDFLRLSHHGRYPVAHVAHPVGIRFGARPA